MASGAGGGWRDGQESDERVSLLFKTQETPPQLGGRERATRTDNETVRTTLREKRQSMSALLGAIVPYAIATIALVLCWRYLHGKHPYLLLAAIYLAVFALWHLLNIRLLEWQAGLPRGIEEWLATAILYVVGVQFLLGNYTCIGQDSPSMTLVTLIDEAGPEGCSREDALRGFHERGHIEERLDAMQSGRLLQSSADGVLTATRFGKFIRWGFDAWFKTLCKCEQTSHEEHENVEAG